MENVLTAPQLILKIEWVQQRCCVNMVQMENVFTALIRSSLVILLTFPLIIGSNKRN